MNIKRAVDGGSTEEQLWDNFFPEMLRYAKGLDRYRMVKQKEKDWPVTVTVIVGPAACGKSYFVQQKRKDDAYWIQPPAPGQQVWFDGYKGQDTIVLDDFFGWMSFNFLLRLLDRYPLPLPVKGSTVDARHREVIITCNRPPWEWYPAIRDKQLMTMDALYTRLSWLLIFVRKDGFFDLPAPSPEMGDSEGWCFKLQNTVGDRRTWNAAEWVDGKKHWDRVVMHEEELIRNRDIASDNPNKPPPARWVDTFPQRPPVDNDYFNM